MLIAAIMTIVEFILFLHKETYTYYFLVFTAFLILNFVAAFFVINECKNNIESTKPIDEFIYEEDRTEVKELSESLSNYKFHGILLGTFIMIGTTSIYFRNLDAIRMRFNSLIPQDSLNDMFFLSQNLGALICGLLAFFFRFDANHFVFATIGAVMAVTAYILCLIFNSLYIETILIGAASGIWWVMPPLIIYQFFGPKPFAGVWGMVLTVNFWGFVIFGLIHAVVWNKTNDPLYIIFGIFSVCSIIGVVATGYVLRRHHEEIH